MSGFKKIDVGGMFALLIFVSAMAGLAFLNGFEQAESYSNKEDKIDDKLTEGSENEIFVKFNEIDKAIMSFFDELKEQIV